MSNIQFYFNFPKPKKFLTKYIPNSQVGLNSHKFFNLILVRSFLPLSKSKLNLNQSINIRRVLSFGTLR